MLSKRRKLHGPACKVTLGILDELSESKFNWKVSFVSGLDEFICYKCKNKAEDLDSLRKKVDKVTEELNGLVSQSQSMETTDGNVEPTVQLKRRRSEDEKEDIVSVSEHTVILYKYYECIIIGKYSISVWYQVVQCGVSIFKEECETAGTWELSFSGNLHGYTHHTMFWSRCVVQ